MQATPDTTRTKNGRKVTAKGKLLMTPEETVGIIGIGRTMMFELIGSGLIGSVKIRRSHRVPVTAIEDFVGAMLEENVA